MHIYLAILVFLITNPLSAQAASEDSNPKKSFFDFSKYAVVEPPTPIEDFEEVDSSPDHASEDIDAAVESVAEAKVQAVQKRNDDIKLLRQQRKKIFEEYSSKRQVIEEKHQSLTQQLSDNSMDTKMSFDLNRKIRLLDVKKKELLQKFRDDSARLSAQTDAVQGRNQSDNVAPSKVQVARPKARPTKKMSIREQLKQKRSAGSRRSKEAVSRRQFTPSAVAPSASTEKSYIKKNIRKAKKAQSGAKGKPQTGGLLNRLKSGR